MRLLALALVAVGLAGLVIGILTIVRGAAGPGALGFAHETYGGPGPLIAGLILLAVGGYLLSAGRSRR